MTPEISRLENITYCVILFEESEKNYILERGIRDVMLFKLDSQRTSLRLYFQCMTLSQLLFIRFLLLTLF